MRKWVFTPLPTLKGDRKATPLRAAGGGVCVCVCASHTGKQSQYSDTHKHTNDHRAHKSCIFKVEHVGSAGLSLLLVPFETWYADRKVLMQQEWSELDPDKDEKTSSFPPKNPEL